MLNTQLSVTGLGSLRWAVVRLLVSKASAGVMFPKPY